MNAPRRAASAISLLIALTLVSISADMAHAQAQIFDLVVSLESNPLGDDDRMQRYHDILQHFSDTVFQATEGAHALGQVQIYVGAAAQDRADIIWLRRAHPKSTLNGLRGPGHIYMADTFTGGAADGGDLPLTDDPDEAGLRAAGAVLAHEWAHYAYGLLDEHVMAGNDVAVSPSLMHSPWLVDADPRWANFSIANSGGGDFQNTERTAHHRAYGISAWELLATQPEIADLLLAAMPGSVERAYYTELAARAPAGEPATGESPPTIPDPIWSSACSSYVIAIDNSGSMTGPPLSVAKGIADILVGFFVADTTWLSIVTFGETAVERTLGPTLVSDEEDANDETERDRLMDRISEIAALPVPTSFSAGLGEALRLLRDADPLISAASNPSCDPAMQGQALFFISDGSNGDPTGSEDADLANAIDAIAAEGIPVYALDVGSFDPDASGNEMTPLVAASGGILMGPTASFNQARQAFGQAEFQTRPILPLHETPTLEFTIPESGSPGVVAFPVDQGLDRISVCAYTDLPVQSLSLRSPSGLTFPPIAARDSEVVTVGIDDCSYFWALDRPPETGLWEVTGAEDSDPDISGDAQVEVVANGHAVGATFALRAWVTNASSPITAPEPIYVSATLGREQPIVGARLFASVGSGGAETLLRDDGIPPDATAGDGIYVGALTYETELSDEEIFVTATNALGIAMLSSQGLVLSPNVQGSVIDPEEDIPLDGVLLRFATTLVSTVDTVGPPAITDEIPVSGRISISGEIDSYDIDLAQVGVGDLEVRVTGALLGMVPRLSVYDGAGALIGEASTSRGTSGVTLAVQSSDGAVRAEVSHANNGTGTYQISAGPRLGLEFGRAGLSNSPCDLALADKNSALAALKDGLSGVATAIVLMEESRNLERTMIEGIRNGLGNGSTGRAGRFLGRAANRDTKALKRMRRAEDRGAEKHLKGARKKIENARKKLNKACRHLDDGGAQLLP